MRRLSARLLCRLAAGAAVTGAVLFAAAGVSPAPVAAPPAETAKPPRWVLREWEGRLALFEEEGAAPAAVYERPLSSLPPAEQEALRTGIPVADEVALAGLLEDYLG